MSRILLLVLGLTQLTACASDADVFYDEFTRLSCRWLQRCAKAGFKEDYSNVRSCSEDFTESYDADEFSDNCIDYDSSRARACLKQLRKEVRTCEIDDAEELCDFARICGNDYTPG